MHEKFSGDSSVGTVMLLINLSLQLLHHFATSPDVRGGWRRSAHHEYNQPRSRPCPISRILVLGLGAKNHLDVELMDKGLEGQSKKHSVWMDMGFKRVVCRRLVYDETLLVAALRTC